MAATIKEMIKKAVAENYQDSFKIGKDKFEDVLTKIVTEGMSPKDAMGFNDNFLNRVYTYAYNLYQGGKYENALEAFEILRMFNPKDARYTLGVAACCHKMKQYREAIEYYICAAILSNNNPMPYYHASDCFIKMGEKLGALMMLNAAFKYLDNDPNNQALKERISQSIKSLEKEMDDEKKAKKLS